jgi:(1->4)-alpha-D-glucan 1-alpha-D-glucosylmutase
MRAPLSTYRLQFHQNFTLADAVRLTAYLEELGITDLYASPVLKAKPGSEHGYDVVDPTQINPELGTLTDFQLLSETLQSKNMGLVLDIVPNHMAASTDNPWWRDLLHCGKKSRYASFFDVDWRQKLLLPVLEKPYGDALESGELQVVDSGGEPALRYRTLILPISIREGADVSTPRGLDHVLSQQPYRLAFWRKTADAVNYRRFFDISDLVSLKAEREEVFRATHEFILRLVKAGMVTGLRIDHIDGLLDPQFYLERLPPVYVVVEKILSGTEALPADWRIFGTTGYDFLNAVNGLFIDGEGYAALKRTYADICGFDASIQDILRDRKQQVMKGLFAAEVRSLAHRLADLADEDWHARDLTFYELEDSLIRVSACLNVYRTYIRPGDSISATDRSRIEDAIAAAQQIYPSAAHDFLRRVLLLEPPYYLEHRRCDWLEFAMRWQQFTGPVMAKGFEDTACYVYNPLASVNEVGADPNGPESSFGVDEFHRRMLERRRRWPDTMNAGSTHDTKRSEDVRARINVLSEIPDEWARSLRNWRRWNESNGVPDANEQILIYQTMLGAWPIEATRLKEYMTKALREAKTHTSWTAVNTAYEQSVLTFIDRILDPERSATFLRDFMRLQKRVAFFGAVSSLSELILRMTAPGAPDFYQGSEIWNFKLTDPDNRSPVDFALREDMLAKLKDGADWQELLQEWQDGRIKMYTIRQTLRFRRDHPELFLNGDYLPLRAKGDHAENVVAFAWRRNDDWAVTVVPRLAANLTYPGSWPVGRRVWRNTSVEMEEPDPREWVNVLTGERVGTSLKMFEIFSKVPFAVLFSSK